MLVLLLLLLLGELLRPGPPDCLDELLVQLLLLDDLRVRGYCRSCHLLAGARLAR